MSNQWYNILGSKDYLVLAAEKPKKKYSARFIDTYGLYYFRDKNYPAILSFDQFSNLLDRLDPEKRHKFYSTYALGAFMPDNSIKYHDLKERESIEKTLSEILLNKRIEDPESYEYQYQNIHHSNSKFSGLDHKEVMKALLDIHFTDFLINYTWHEVIGNDGKWGIVISEQYEETVGHLFWKKRIRTTGEPCLCISPSLIQSVDGIIGDFKIISRNGTHLRFKRDGLFCT